MYTSLRERVQNEQEGYYLSTAEKGFGVVSARSEAGVLMKPVALMEMECPKTRARPLLCAFLEVR
ncbi:hypothetical protein PTSG_02422 [Salpingoeca rosetta]|uniref:Uncharacterized protein n=1 Tax=Salpingoeca rosetta (strain ATCC 50818 / BSB-021) TaxID=946362 RepID=F2U259_SALR5|nr:uncharacterized protein PTSG_02422 [Salpingoeca rosetta]EGD81711.1 hypothetical protein PTSG_02422 [Salpingoeca rosetta]|eukprot:XP_004996915.1 hypothetical protein PTSG_02422 [Salpingoeca rosetta]